MTRPKLLFLSSVPRGQDALDVPREIEEIERRAGDAIEVEFHHCVTASAIHQRIERARPDIVQITAHGAASGRLILEGDIHDRHAIDGEALARICGAVPTVKLLVLRSCHSYPLAREVARTIGLAIGMQHKVDDHATIAFVASLYHAIAEGLAVVEAFGRAMRAYEAYSAESTTGPQLATAGPASDHRFVEVAAPRHHGKVQPCLVPPLDRPPRRFYVAPHGLLPGLHEVLARRSACVLNLVGPGGSGKTAGLTRWLAQLQKLGFRGLERVFAWSFDLDETPGERHSAATRCAVAALKYFADDGDGDLALTSPGQTALVGWALGQRLAQVLQRRRSLLVLDGVSSPLQHPAPRSGGAALDPVLDGLLHECALLGRPYGSLVVLGSRTPLWSPPGPPGFAAMDLPPIDLDAAQVLLRRLGVGGGDEAVREVASRCNQHPLALTLIAHEIVYHHAGDARAATRMDGQARGVAWALECYGAGLGEAEREGLHKVVLTQELSAVEDPALGEYLRDYLLTTGVAYMREAELRVHAMLRAHLEQHSPLAHDIRDDRYHRTIRHAVVTADGPLRRRESMPAVLNAIVHAARAKRWHEARSLYFKKFVGDVRRPLLTREHGMIVPALLAIQQFFRAGWKPVWDGLGPASAAVLLHHAGLALRHLGCTPAAVEPLRQALAGFIAGAAGGEAHGIDADERAATCANDLAEVFIGLGRLDQALAMAEQGEKLAARVPAGTDGIRHALASNTATRAEVLRLRGEHELARAAFVQLVMLFDVGENASRVPQSRPGHYWWRWQLDELERLTGPERTRAASELRALLDDAGAWSERPGVARVTRALVWLCEGRYWLVMAPGDADPAAALERARQALASATRRIRETEHLWLLPSVYVDTARLRRLAGDPAGATLDLRRAEELAGRFELELAGIDAAIEGAALEQALHTRDMDDEHLHRVAAQLERARRRIAVSHYQVRVRECDGLDAWLAGRTGAWPGSE